MDKIVTAADFKAAFPDLYKSIFDEAAAAGHTEGRREGMEAGIAQGRTEGAAGELARIQGVKATSIPGMEVLVDQMIADGKTTPEQAAVRILEAHKANLAKHNQDFRLDNGQKIPQADGSAADPNQPSADAPLETRAKYTWEHSADVRDEFMGSFDAYMAFMKASESGVARVYKGTPRRDA